MINYCVRLITFSHSENGGTKFLKRNMIRALDAKDARRIKRALTMTNRPLQTELPEYKCDVLLAVWAGGRTIYVEEDMFKHFVKDMNAVLHELETEPKERLPKLATVDED